MYYHIQAGCGGAYYQTGAGLGIVKRWILFFLVIFLSVPSQAQEGSRAFEKAFEQPDPEEVLDPALAGDIRGFVWGLDRNSVREFESAEFLGPIENALVYKGKDFGFKSYIQYYFYEDKLGRAIVLYNDKNSNAQDYLNDYISVQSKISKLYGPPVSDNVVWNDKRYQDDPEHWGQAMLMGFVEFRSVWSTPTSVIQLELTGSKMRQNFRAVYISKTVLAEENEVPLVPQNPLNPVQP